MRATDIRVLSALDPGQLYTEANFLLVETTVGEQSEPVTSIDHFRADFGKVWVVEALRHSVAMTHPVAREWAVAYAAGHGVPVVYERDETT